MNANIAASTIASATTPVTVIDFVDPNPGSPRIDTLLVNYTGDKDIILQLGIDGPTSIPGATKNAIRIEANAGRVSIPVRAELVRAVHAGVAPTSGTLDVSIFASGL